MAVPSSRKNRVLLPTASPFPAVEGVPAKPRWYVRLRGVVGMSVLVVILGVLAAVAFAIVLAVLAILVISFIA